MKFTSLLLVSALFGVLPQHAAIAGPASDALGACMVDSLTGKERKELAQWIFFGMAAHPDIKQFAKISTEDQVNIDRYVGILVTRLLSKDCVQQTKNAMQADGPNSMKDAFGLVGQVAMQELMTNKEVSTSLFGYINYLDKNELSSVLTSK